MNTPDPRMRVPYTGTVNSRLDNQNQVNIQNTVQGGGSGARPRPRPNPYPYPPPPRRYGPTYNGQYNIPGVPPFVVANPYVPVSAVGVGVTGMAPPNMALATATTAPVAPVMDTQQQPMYDQPYQQVASTPAPSGMSMRSKLMWTSGIMSVLVLIIAAVWYYYRNHGKGKGGKFNVPANGIKNTRFGNIRY